MPEKPKFNPNEPYKTVNTAKPAFDPNQDFKVIDEGRTFDRDSNVELPKYTTPQDLEIDSTLNFIQENSLRTMRDDEKDILKNMMKNPLTSKEELSDAIVTLQGKKAKQIDNSWTTPDYYMKRDEKSGNYKPIALEQGEKIPVGYHAASIWGTKESAKDDNAWQDIGKSLANGVFGLMGGVVDVAQSGYELVTGDESETLRSGKNAIEGLKFEKDADLDRPVYNMEGITKWADLLDKDRFDFSPQALWGTFNSTAESLTEFGLGSLTGATWLKGAKALKYGYKGIDKALDLGKAGKLGAIFTGSFFTNIGETRDAAEEAGLEGRDKGAVSLGIATVKSAIDAAFGLEGKIMSNAFKASEREVFKNLIKKAEKDAVTGLITPNGFKQLMKEASLEYSTLAKVGSKSGQVVKDMIEEGSNEVATDFAQKAGEQLWDKLTPDERGQFGTDAFDAKSFGSYANSFTQGAISGGMMSIPSQVLKNNHDRQSINAYERVKEGPEAVNALRTDLNNALDKGEITPSEHEQANFKIDAYSKYNEETKGVNLKPENEKKAFELSFQIQGLKTEIPTNENEISKLDPIARAKVESKQKQAKELQSELNDIIRQGEIKGEPVIPKKEEERIQKEKEKEIKVEETNSKLSQEKEVEKAKTRQPDIEGLGKEKVITYPKLENKPYWKDDKRTYEEIDTEEFNNPSTDARTIHRVVRKEAYNKPNRKLFGNLTKRLYSYINDEGDRMKGDVIEVTMEDGKKIRVASSKQEFKDENDKTVRWDDIFRRHFRSERTQGNEEGLPVGIRAVDLNNPLNEDKGPDYKPGKIALKVFDARTGKFLSWAKETKTGSAESLDKAGNELYTAEQKDLLKTLEQQMYNENPEGGDVIERLTKPKPKPTPTDLKAQKTDIERRNKETESKIKNKELFLAEYDEKGNKIGESVGEMISQSSAAPIATSVREQDGFEFVEFSNPQTGQVDVIVSGDTKGNYVGFYRLYENGKPTNKWSSKMNSKSKTAFKTMISGVQEMLPQNHEYSEKTSISTDGLRVWNQQLQRGYELQYDSNGDLITDAVAINGDALVNELGIDVNEGNFDNISVTSKKQFETVKKALLPYLEKFGLNESNIRNVSGTVEIDLPVLRKSNTTQPTTQTSNQSEIEAKKADIEKRSGLNGVEEIIFSNPNFRLEGFEIDGNYWNVVTSTDRAKVLVNINGVIVPFYLTTGQAGKGLVPGWYPFFGIGKDGWLNKTDKSDMETYYERYWGKETADIVKSISEELNGFYGTDPSAFKNDGDPNATSRPLTTLADKVEDYINSKLNYTPAINNADARKTLRSNVEQLGKEINAKYDAELAALEGTTTTTEKAKVATEKIVEEGKAKVAEQKASVPLTITKAVKQQLYDLGYSKVNVDNMKPERALDIINKQETNKKEVISEKESTKKEPAAKKDSSSLRRKITGYNQLSSDEKKSDFGVNLRKEIQKEVEEFGGSLKPLLKGKIQLLDSEGKQVKKAPIKRKQSVIDAEKAIAKKRKDALSTNPTTPEQYIAMVIGSKGQFKESVVGEIPDVPSMMKDFKNGYTLESLYQGYQEKSGFYDINEDDFNSRANSFLSDYLTKGGRDLAIDYAVEAYEREINDGYTDKEIAEMVAYGESLGLTENEVVVIDESVQNLNEEEVTELETKIENTNEKDRNEESANKIIQNIAGEEGSNKSPFDEMESEQDSEEGKDIIKGEEGAEPFQKVSQRKGDFQKVFEKIQANFKGITVVEDASKFKGEQSTVAGKVSADGKTIYINPNYAGLDTPIHEAGHILIDAMGYNNRIIQAAIKQLRTTPLYAETKERYKELSESELDKEVLAEAIGREGADIFDKVEDRSKFKAYLDYIFDWLKQKLGLDKNVAKSLAKQIIGGVKTKELKGVATGKEQLQKDKKKPFADQALKYNQYATAEGFDAQKEFDKYEQATVELREVKEDEKLATIAADEAVTDEEIKSADAELEKQRALLKEASKEFAIKAKRYLGYLKYKKDFRAVQAILKDKDLDEYTENELNDLITKLFSFNDRAAKAVKERAYQRLGHLVTVKQNEIHKDKEGFIEALGKTSDISPLQSKILHYSQFSEKNADMQALALANGKAIIDKITEANSLKDTHAKLGLKVIQEENKRLGITGKAANRFSSDSSKYFEWMIDDNGNYLTIDEAKAKGLSKAKLDYLDFHRETVAGYRESMSANDYENVKMGAIRVDKNFREAYKSEGLIPAFSYYLGGGATNLGRVRILHNGKVMSYSEIEKEIIAGVDKKNIKSIAKALYNLLVANIKARRQLKKGQNIDEKDNPLELKGDAEYSLNEKGQLVSKFDKPRAKDRGYSKDFYKAMNQFIDESAHVKHISKIMPLVEAIEYLNKYGYMEEGYVPKKNVSKWINDWKALQIFKEPYVNDPVIDAAIKSLRKLVASTTMWFNIPANAINVFVGNYNNWRAENAETLARGNARLFGGKGSRKKVGIVNDYALAIIKKYNLVNQDFDSHPVIKAGSIFSKLATWGTQVGEYQIQGSLGLGLLNQEEFDSFEFTKDKYGNDVLTVKPNGKYTEDEIKSKMTQVKNRVTDIQGKYPDEDRRNIMRGEFGKALFQFKVWMPDWFKERFSARYFNAYGQEKEGSYTKMLRVGVKEMAADLKKGDIKKALTNPAFVQNLKGMATIGALLALKHGGDDDDDKKKGGLNWDSALSQVLFIFDLEQDKYMVSNPAAILGKIKDMLNAFEALVGFEEDAWQKTKRILPGGKAVTFVENQIK
jgi:hypothetical protein